MPLRSHSAYFQPGRMLSRSSICTNPMAGLSISWSSLALASTRSRPSSSRQMGTITALRWATLGGITRPASSLWLMINAPISRVLTPQLVAHTNSSVPSLVWYFTSKALAKF